MVELLMSRRAIVSSAGNEMWIGCAWMGSGMIVKHYVNPNKSLQPWLASLSTLHIRDIA
jgi:hypothetical protein